MKKLLIVSLLSVGLSSVAMDHPLASASQENEGASTLILSTRFGDAQEVSTFLSSEPVKAQINAQDDFGRTAIWYAAAMGKDDTYNTLLSAGADATIKSTGGPLAGTSAQDLRDMDQATIKASLAKSKM